MNTSDAPDFFGEEWKSQKTEPPQPKFQPSDKVVCLYPCIVNAENYTDVPLPGKLYAVRECEPDRITLVGIIGKFDAETLKEHAFKPDRFVSLDEYRRLLGHQRRLESAFQETKAFWEEVDALDDEGNPRPKRKSRPKKAP